MGETPGHADGDSSFTVWEMIPLPVWEVNPLPVWGVNPLPVFSFHK